MIPCMNKQQEKTAHVKKCTSSVIKYRAEIAPCEVSYTFLLYKGYVTRTIYYLFSSCFKPLNDFSEGCTLLQMRDL